MCPCLHPPCACLRKQQSRLLWLPCGSYSWGNSIVPCFFLRPFSFLDSCLRRKDTHWIPACAGMTHEAGLSTAREEAKVPLTRPACRFLAVAALAGLSRRGRGELVPSPLVGEG
jgi:hypothetical protein